MPKLDKWLKNILRNRLFPILSKNHKFAVDTFKFRDLFFVYYNASDDAINKNNNNNNNQHNNTTTACLDVKDAHDAERNKEPQQRSVGIHRDGSVISFNVLLNSESVTISVNRCDNFIISIAPQPTLLRLHPLCHLVQLQLPHPYHLSRYLFCHR